VFGAVAKIAVVVSVAGPGFSREIDDRTVARWAHAGGVGYLIRAAWTEGEAAEKQLTVSDRDVEEAMQEPHDGLTEPEDLRYEARIDLLNAALKEPQLQAAAQSVTPEQIDAWLQTHPLNTLGERRFRVLKAPNRARAKAIEAALERGVTWDRAARKYAPHTGPELDTAPAPPRSGLEKAVYRAKKNRITRYGRYVFKVVGETLAGPLPREQQRATAWEILAGEAQAKAVHNLQAAIAAKWRPRTSCQNPTSAPGLCGNSPTG
jgi:hypothetical protein